MEPVVPYARPGARAEAPGIVKVQKWREAAAPNSHWGSVCCGLRTQSPVTPGIGTALGFALGHPIGMGALPDMLGEGEPLSDPIGVPIGDSVGLWRCIIPGIGCTIEQGEMVGPLSGISSP